MPKRMIKDYPEDVVSSSAKTVEELNNGAPVTKVSDTADTVTLNLDDIDVKANYDELLGIIELLIKDEENDIRALEDRIKSEVKELEGRIERQRKRIDSLKGYKRDILVKTGEVVEKRDILYEFAKDGATVYSTDYDEAVKFADDPRKILIHSARWNEKKKKWIID